MLWGKSDSCGCVLSAIFLGLWKEMKISISGGWSMEDFWVKTIHTDSFFPRPLMSSPHTDSAYSLCDV